jgi:hypothetical protein
VPSDPDIDHLHWLVKSRYEIQETLLALYRNIKLIPPERLNLLYDRENRVIDHLVAAAFSLWRAVFLAETTRDWHEVRKHQIDFLLSVVTNNAITYSDDKKNRAWTVGYYLSDAKMRLAVAADLMREAMQISHSLAAMIKWVSATGQSTIETQIEWILAHALLRIIFNSLNPSTPLPTVEIPPLPEALKTQMQ